MRPLLARDGLGDEIVRCRIDDCRDGDDTRITRQDGIVRDLVLLRQALGPVAWSLTLTRQEP